MLTLDMLKEMKSHEHFTGGTTIDNPSGINITNSGRILRWVAVRGGIHDWAIYINWDCKTEEEVVCYGDKVHTEANIKKLVPCTDEAYKMYRW
jgi:hypothetical protein